MTADGSGELMETAGDNAKTGGPEAGDVMLPEASSLLSVTML